jgi:hypothetical protein
MKPKPTKYTTIKPIFNNIDKETIDFIQWLKTTPKTFIGMKSPKGGKIPYNQWEQPED